MAGGMLPCCQILSIADCLAPGRLWPESTDTRCSPVITLHYSLALLLSTHTNSMPPLNFTAPSDWTDHGIPGLVCQPSTWLSITEFFLSSYVAHALTIKKLPGQSPIQWFRIALIAFFSPVWGMGRAISILSKTGRIPFLGRRDALQRAHAAGALCMIVRAKDWRPLPGDTIRNLTASDLLRVCRVS